jgi:hypothetical protein
MGGTCGMCGEEEKCVHSFGGGEVQIEEEI